MKKSLDELTTAVFDSFDRMLPEADSSDAPLSKKMKDILVDAVQNGNELYVNSERKHDCPTSPHKATNDGLVARGMIVPERILRSAEERANDPDFPEITTRHAWGLTARGIATGQALLAKRKRQH